MSDATQQNPGTTKTRQPIQIKNRTVLIVTLFVIIPWVALALPGYHAGEQLIDEDNTKTGSIQRKFGWPLAHKTESQTTVIGAMRGGQFRAGDPIPKEKFDPLQDKHFELYQASGSSSVFNLIPKAREGQSFASLWTNKNSYPTELRKYIQDNVLKIGLIERWNIPMLVVNVLLLMLACLGVGYLVEKSSK